MYTFKQDTQLLIDRSYIQFKGCEFNLLRHSTNEILIQLTRDGINQLVDNIKSRDNKHGSDDYLIEFLVDELEGELLFYSYSDDDFDDHEYQLVNTIIKSEVN